MLYFVSSSKLDIYPNMHYIKSKINHNEDRKFTRVYNNIMDLCECSFYNISMNFQHDNLLMSFIDSYINFENKQLLKDIVNIITKPLYSQHKFYVNDLCFLNNYNPMLSCVVGSLLLIMSDVNDIQVDSFNESLFNGVRLANSVIPELETVLVFDGDEYEIKNGRIINWPNKLFNTTCDSTSFIIRNS